MPGWNDGAEAVSAADGQAYFAPVGTTLPALNASSTAVLPATWNGGGFVSEEGFGHTLARTIADIRAFQALTPIRRVKETEDLNLTFQLMQWNGENLIFAFGGGTVTDQGAGKFSYEYPAAEDGLVERSLIIDIKDGTKNYRFVFNRGSVSEPVESNFRRNEAALLPVTFGVLAPEGGGRPAYLLTDDPAFAAGS